MQNSSESPDLVWRGKRWVQDKIFEINLFSDSAVLDSMLSSRKIFFVILAFGKKGQSS
jgi:hypothetical protein